MVYHFLTIGASGHVGTYSPLSSNLRLNFPPRVELLEDVFRRLEPRHMIPSSEIRRIRVLGSGTFGEVVLGEWLGTRVALKTQKEQPPSLEKKPDAKSEFQVELNILSDLSHSKVVRFLGACSSPPVMVLHHHCVCV